jgi:hypothetical protein
LPIFPNKFNKLSKNSSPHLNVAINEVAKSESICVSKGSSATSSFGRVKDIALNHVLIVNNLILIRLWLRFLDSL